MSARVTRRRKLTAVLAGALAPLMLLTGVLLPGALEETDAGWTDTADVRGTVSAVTIPAPTLTRQCEFRPGVLGVAARVRIHWALPEGYELDHVSLRRSSDGIGSILEPVLGFGLIASTVHHAEDDTYTTTIPAGLLGGLLGLGPGMHFGLVVEDPSGWRSEMALIEARSYALGIGTCEHLTE